MAQQTLKMTRGRTASWQMTVTDQDGTVVNLTGMTARFVVKRDKQDDDAAALVNLTSPGGGINILAPTSGILTVTIPPAATASLAVDNYGINAAYELLLTDSSANIFSVLSGPFTILSNTYNG